MDKSNIKERLDTLEKVSSEQETRANRQRKRNWQNGKTVEKFSRLISVISWIMNHLKNWQSCWLMQRVCSFYSVELLRFVIFVRVTCFCWSILQAWGCFGDAMRFSWRWNGVLKVWFALNFLTKQCKINNQKLTDRKLTLSNRDREAFNFALASFSRTLKASNEKF